MALHGELGQVFQQGFAIASPALLGKDKQVLQVETFAPHEGGEIVEEEGEAYHRSALLGKDHLGRTLHEERVVEGLLVGHHLVGALLVDGQPFDKVEHEARLFGFGGADGEEHLAEGVVHENLRCRLAGQHQHLLAVAVDK